MITEPLNQHQHPPHLYKALSALEEIHEARTGPEEQAPETDNCVNAAVPVSLLASLQ